MPAIEPEEPRLINLGEPQEDFEFEPPLERVRRATTVPQDEETAEVKRDLSSTSSLSDHIDEEPEEPPELLSAVSRQPTLTYDTAVVEPEAEFEAPVMRMARSITQPSRRQSIRSPSPIPEETIEEPSVSRTVTRQPTYRSDYPEPEPDFEPPVVRMARSMSRRESMRSPSPVPGEPAETPVVSPFATRQSTRKTTQPIVDELDEPEPEPPVMAVRRASTQPPPPTPEPEVEEPPIRRVTTRRPADETPPPEPAVRRAPSRRLTERLLSPDPVEEPTAPPSSPSTEEEVRPPSRKQTLGLEGQPRRTTTTFEEPTLRRQSTQPEKFTLPESSSSYASNTSLLPDEDPVLDDGAWPLPAEPEDVEFAPPVERIWRQTTTIEPVDVPTRQSTLKPSLSISRRTTATSRHPTFAERRATFETSTAIPSRQSTIMSDPTATELPTGLSRSNTHGILKRPTRRPTEAELVPLPPSRALSRRPTEADLVPLPPSRALTRQPTEADLVPLPPSRALTRQPTEADLVPLPPSRALTRQPTEPQMIALPPSRQLTRQRTEPQSIPLPLSRQPTERLVDFPSRRPSNYDIAVLNQRNAEESPEDGQLALEQQPSRRPTDAASRKQSEYSMPGLIQRNVQEEDPEFDEQVVERQPTRQRTTVSRRPTRAPTRQSMEFEVESQPRESDESLSSTANSVSEPPPIPSRRTTIRKSTVIERQATSSSEAMPENPPDFARRKNTTLGKKPTIQSAPEQLPSSQASSVYSELAPDLEVPRRISTARTVTGLTGLTTSSSEPQEFASIEQMRERAASRKPTIESTATTTDPVMPIMRMRQETQPEELEARESVASCESESRQAAPLNLSSRVPTQALDAELSTPLSRRSTKDRPRQPSQWSTEALKDEELPPTAVSRQITELSRRPTRQSTVALRPTTVRGETPATEQETSAIEETPAPITRLATRKPTRVSRQPTATDRTPSIAIQSRQPTRRPTGSEESPFLGVGRMVESESEPGDDEPVPLQGPALLPQEDQPLIDLHEEPTMPSRTATQRAPTAISRQPTRASTAPDEGLVQRSAVDHEPTAERDSAHSSLLDEPLAAYDVYNALPAIAPEPPVNASDQQPEEKPSSKTPQVVETMQRVVEREPTMPAEEIPEQEPSRNDRSPTALLSRDPESLAPPLVQRDVDAEPAESPVPERQNTRFDPKVDDRVPRILTVPSERPRRVSVAPGIEAPPPELVQRNLMPTGSEKKPRKKAPNYPPDQQHPVAPPYPSRVTPAWTKPDTYTPLKPRVEPERKQKRRLLGLVAKPRYDAQPIEQAHPPPEPHRDRPLVKPFRDAAPGRTLPGPPGGTLQRPRGYINPPGHEPFRPADPRGRPHPPIPTRNYDYPARAAPVYARKDDYYPRLTPVRRDYPQPSFPAPQRAYPQAKSRDPPKVPARHEPRPQPLRGEASEPIRDQPQPEQASRYQEKTPNWFQAHLPSRRPKNDKESSRSDPAPPVRRNVHEDSQAEGQPIRKVESERSETQTQEEVSRPSKDKSQPIESSRRGSERIASPRYDRPSEVPMVAAERRSEQASAPKRQSTTIGEAGRAHPQAETSSPEDSGHVTPAIPSKEEGDSPSARHSPDITREPPSAGSGPSRTGTERPSGPSRKPTAQDQARKRSPVPEPEEEAPDARTASRRAIGRRASEARESSPPARKNSTAASRRPSTALERTRTERRSSATDWATGRPTPSRAPTAPTRMSTNATQSRALSRRRTDTPPAPVSRATNPTSGPGEAGTSGTAQQSDKPSPPAKLGSEQQPSANERTADKRSEQPSAKPSNLPRRSTTVYDSSSSDPNAIPQHAAKPSSGRKDSFFGQRSPAKRTVGFFGRGKESTPAPRTQDATGPGGTRPQPPEQPKGQQPGGKVAAKAVQGSSGVNPLRGRWGWGWGRG